MILFIYSLHLKKDFTYLFLERREGREKGRETLMCERYIDRPATKACALTENQTGDLLVHRPALNPLSHTSQGESFFS